MDNIELTTLPFVTSNPLLLMKNNAGKFRNVSQKRSGFECRVSARSGLRDLDNDGCSISRSLQRRAGPSFFAIR